MPFCYESHIKVIECKTLYKVLDSPTSIVSFWDMILPKTCACYNDDFMERSTKSERATSRETNRKSQQLIFWGVVLPKIYTQDNQFRNFSLGLAFKTHYYDFTLVVIIILFILISYIKIIELS